MPKTNFRLMLAALSVAFALPTLAQDAAKTPPPVPAPQTFDYSANMNSDAFGANLFTGAFARQGASQFNPDYAVSIGDKIQVRMWGALDRKSVV